MTTVQAYLDFDGRCEEALKFYEEKLGAKINVMMRFKDAPPGNECPPDEGNKMTPEHVMHSCFRIGGTDIMASDCRCGGKVLFGGFSLSLNVETEEEADGYFNALAESGKIEMPLAPTFWTPKFGVVTDKFGVSWMVNVNNPQNQQEP